MLGSPAGGGGSAQRGLWPLAPAPAPSAPPAPPAPAQHISAEGYSRYGVYSLFPGAGSPAPGVGVGAALYSHTSAAIGRFAPGQAATPGQASTTTFHAAHKVTDSLFSSSNYTAFGAPTPPPGSPYSPVPVAQLELLAKNISSSIASAISQAAGGCDTGGRKTLSPGGAGVGGAAGAPGGPAPSPEPGKITRCSADGGSRCWAAVKAERRCGCQRASPAPSAPSGHLGHGHVPVPPPAKTKFGDNVSGCSRTNPVDWAPGVAHVKREPGTAVGATPTPCQVAEVTTSDVPGSPVVKVEAASPNTSMASSTVTSAIKHDLQQISVPTSITNGNIPVGIAVARQRLQQDLSSSPSLASAGLLTPIAPSQPIKEVSRITEIDAATAAGMAAAAAAAAGGALGGALGGLGALGGAVLQCGEERTAGLAAWPLGGAHGSTLATPTLWQYPAPMPVEPMLPLPVPMPPVGFQLVRDPTSGHFLLIPTASLEQLQQAVVWPSYPQPSSHVLLPPLPPPPPLAPLQLLSSATASSDYLTTSTTLHQHTQTHSTRLVAVTSTTAPPDFGKHHQHHPQPPQQPQQQQHPRSTKVPLSVPLPLPLPAHTLIKIEADCTATATLDHTKTVSVAGYAEPTPAPQPTGTTAPASLVTTHVFYQHPTTNLILSQPHNHPGPTPVDGTVCKSQATSPVTCLTPPPETLAPHAHQEDEEGRGGLGVQDASNQTDTNILGEEEAETEHTEPSVELTQAPPPQPIPSPMPEPENLKTQPRTTQSPPDISSTFVPEPTEEPELKIKSPTDEPPDTKPATKPDISGLELLSNSIVEFENSRQSAETTPIKYEVPDYKEEDGVISENGDDVLKGIAHMTLKDCETDNATLNNNTGVDDTLGGLGLLCALAEQRFMEEVVERQSENLGRKEARLRDERPIHDLRLPDGSRDGSSRNASIPVGLAREEPIHDTVSRDTPLRNGVPRNGLFHSGSIRNGISRDVLTHDEIFRNEINFSDVSMRNGISRDRLIHDGMPRNAPHDLTRDRLTSQEGEISDELPRDLSIWNGLPRNGHIRDGSPRNGHLRRDGSPRNGHTRVESPLNGLNRNGLPRNGQTRESPNGPVRNGLPVDRFIHNGLSRNGLFTEEITNNGLVRERPSRDNLIRDRSNRDDSGRDGLIQNDLIPDRLNRDGSTRLCRDGSTRDELTQDDLTRERLSQTRDRLSRDGSTHDGSRDGLPREGLIRDKLSRDNSEEHRKDKRKPRHSSLEPKLKKFKHSDTSEDDVIRENERALERERLSVLRRVTGERGLVPESPLGSSNPLGSDFEKRKPDKQRKEMDSAKNNCNCRDDRSSHRSYKWDSEDESRKSTTSSNGSKPMTHTRDWSPAYMSAVERDMRQQLADLQRQYKEKQLELSKLAPKKPPEYKDSKKLPLKPFRKPSPSPPPPVLDKMDSPSPVRLKGSSELLKPPTLCAVVPTEAPTKLPELPEAKHHDSYKRKLSVCHHDSSDSTPEKISSSKKRKVGRPKKLMSASGLRVATTETIVAKKPRAKAGLVGYLLAAKSRLQMQHKAGLGYAESSPPKYSEDVSRPPAPTTPTTPVKNKKKSHKKPKSDILSVVTSNVKSSDQTPSSEPTDYKKSENRASKIRPKLKAEPTVKSCPEDEEEEEEEEEEDDEAGEEDEPPEAAIPENAEPVPSPLVETSPAPTVEDHRCILTSAHLAIDRLRVLTAMGGLFYAGQLTAVRAPDVYAITLDGERGNRPHIMSREEILRDAIVEVSPGSTSELLPGTRLCAYWSQQYRCLYPGTVAEPGTPDPQLDLKFVCVEFDDGDSGRIALEDIRLLPVDYPIIEYDPNPLLSLSKRRRRTSVNSVTEERRLTNQRNSVPSAAPPAPAQPPAPAPEPPKPASPLAEKENTDINRQMEQDSHRERKRLKKRRKEKLKKLLCHEDKKKKRKHKCCDEHCKHRKHHKKHRKHKKHHHRSENDEGMEQPTAVVGEVEAVNENVEVEEEEEEEENIVPKKVETKSKKSKKRKERRESVESRSKMAAFLPARQLWGWSGRGYKRVGVKGRARKQFFKAIQRGKESIMVGDCAVFLSTGRPDRPYIGKIEAMWESWGTNMVVRVKWFYHPEETVGCPLNLKYPGALFESPHVDENDVQTISHKCEVLPLKDYTEKLGPEPQRYETIYDNNDIYYLAGYYDPTTTTLTMEPGIPFAENK